MTMNQPPLPESPALLDRLRQGMAAAVMHLDLPDILHYPALGPGIGPGIGDAREDRLAGAAWIAPRLPDVPAERLLVTPGTQSALLALLTALTRPGDTVCAEALTYPGFKAIAGQLGLRIVGVPMEADGIDPDALRHVCPNIGRRCSIHPDLPQPDDRNASIGASSRRHRGGSRPRRSDYRGRRLRPLPNSALPPLAALAPESVYHIAGLAKCVSPMLRVSYVVSPDARQNLRVAAAQRGTTLMASPLTAAIARRWIADGTAGATWTPSGRSHGTPRARQIHPAGGQRRDQARGVSSLAAPAGDVVARRIHRASASRGIAAVASDAFATMPGTPDAVRICLGAASGREETRQVLEIIADALDQLPSSAGVII